MKTFRAYPDSVITHFGGKTMVRYVLQKKSFFGWKNCSPQIEKAEAMLMLEALSEAGEHVIFPKPTLAQDTQR